MTSTESERTPQVDRARKATTRPESRRGMTRGAIRAQRRARSEGRKRRKRMFWYAGAALVAAAFIASLLVPGGLRSNVGNVASTINTGGPVPILPEEGRQHIEPGISHSGFATKPATSGPHWQTLPTGAAPDGAPARWGAYDYPLPDEVLVHNLEHGGIGLHYDCQEPGGCPELVEQLKGIMGRNPSLFIVSPYPGMDQRIAVTAWRHLMYLDEFDAAKIREFVDAYQNRAPESVPHNQF